MVDETLQGAAADGSFALDDPAASAIISGGAGSIAADDVVTINHTAAGAVEAFAGETSLGTASGETTNPTATAGSVVTAGGITLFTARTLATKDGLCTSILPGPIADSDTFTLTAAMTKAVVQFPLKRMIFHRCKYGDPWMIRSNRLHPFFGVF